MSKPTNREKGDKKKKNVPIRFIFAVMIANVL